MNKQEIEKSIKSLKHHVATWKGKFPSPHFEACETAIKCMEKQLTNGWIPVSERLPEEYGRYLVTTVYGKVKESEFDLKKWWQIDNSTISLEWEEEPNKVVAWRPLPPKYEEVSE